MAMREVGRGNAALEKVYGFLNLLEPPHPATVETKRKTLMMHTITLLLVQ